MNAIILAAGKGERLKPLTDKVPKPLIEVSGKTLLERNINRLYESGVRNIIVNGSKMGEKIELFLEKYQQSVINIEFINEGEEPLGTAGAIFNIIDRGLIKDEQFWIVNADIMTSFSFKCISLKPGIMGHIVLVPNPEHNPNGDFCLDGDRVTISNNQRYTFSGISFFSINCFKQSSKRYFSLADLLNEYIDKEMITGELFQGDWLDIGTADRLAQAEKVCTKKSNE